MDHFEIEVRHVASGTFHIIGCIINQAGNTLPIVMLNNMHVTEGKQSVLTVNYLQIYDRDTRDEDLVILVVRAPRRGSISKDGIPGTKSFSMADIKNCLIRYKHDDSDTYDDDFHFIVTDGQSEDFFVYPRLTHPVRHSQILHIVVTPVDDSIPRMVTNLGASTLSPALDLYVFMLTKSVLRAEDDDSPDHALMYVITSSQENGGITHLSSDGQWTRVSNFSQGEVVTSLLNRLSTMIVSIRSSNFPKQNENTS
jgi:hypothetical protein